MGLDIAAAAITWHEAEAVIADGSTTELAKLQRSEEELARYRAFRAQLLLEWSSVLCYLKSELFECIVTVNEEGKKCAELCAHVEQQKEPVVRWRDNDFPYNFEPSIRHHVLWSSKPLDTEAIWAHIRQRFPPTDEAIYWVNPPELQSIKALWHAHVLSRARPG